MENIIIKRTDRKEGDCWGFKVDITNGEREPHLVSVDKEYWQELTGGAIEPEDLVRLSLEFLLAREPREKILQQFNLRVMSGYFPEYEKEIKEKVGS